MSKNRFSYSSLTNAQKEDVAQHIALYEVGKHAGDYATELGRADAGSAAVLSQIDFKGMSSKDIADLAGRLQGYNDPGHDLYDNIPGLQASSRGLGSLNRLIELSSEKPGTFKDRVDSASNEIGRYNLVDGAVVFGAVLGAASGGSAMDVAAGLAGEALRGNGELVNGLPIVGGLIEMAGDIKDIKGSVVPDDMGAPLPAAACQRKPTSCGLGS